MFPDRLDRHSLRQFLGPFLLAVGTLLVAQLLERTLRLFDLAAATGTPLSDVAVMIANLVPHYLGISLPAAMMAGMFMAAARLSDENELDVMLATGRSGVRIITPYMAFALLLTAFNAYLYGFLQPHSRYDYRAALHQSLQAGWNARVEDRRFIDTGQGYILSAESVEPDGETLRRVFLIRLTDTSEEVTTAARGKLVPDPSSDMIKLELDDGRMLQDAVGAKDSVLRFGHAAVNADFTPKVTPFRDRGDSVRELTFPELWTAIHQAGAKPEVAAEFHGRLARALLLPLLPLLALPLGTASKRGHRTPGVVFAGLAFLVIQHALEFGESLAERGQVPAIAAVWTPYLVFGALCVLIFRGSLSWPGDNPINRTVNALASMIDALIPKRLLRKRS